MGCPHTRACSNWRRSGQKTPPSPPLPPPSPPPPPPAGPDEDPAATAAASAAPRGGTAAQPGAAIPGLDRAARVGPGAGYPRGDVCAGDPRAPSPRAGYRSRTSRGGGGAQKRGRAWGPHAASGQPQGMTKNAPPRAGKVPRSPAARRPRPGDENWTCH